MDSSAGSVGIGNFMMVVTRDKTSQATLPFQSMHWLSESVLVVYDVFCENSVPRQQAIVFNP